MIAIPTAFSVKHARPKQRGRVVWHSADRFRLKPSCMFMGFFRICLACFWAGMCEPWNRYCSVRSLSDESKTVRNNNSGTELRFFRVVGHSWWCMAVGATVSTGRDLLLTFMGTHQTQDLGTTSLPADDCPCAFGINNHRYDKHPASSSRNFSARSFHPCEHLPALVSHETTRDPIL